MNNLSTGEITRSDYYRTANLSLCPYLSMHGLKYVSAEMADSGKVFFIFEDPAGMATELVMAFYKSKEKTYKSLWQYFRNEVDAVRKKSRFAANNPFPGISVHPSKLIEDEEEILD